MKAAYYTDYGKARDVLKIGALAIPELGPNDVRVRLAFSGINPSDCNRRRGLWEKLQDTLIIPHNDGAGVIEAVGADVDPARRGERVWIWNGQRDGRTLGTAAEYIVLDQKYAVQLPDSVSLEEGACFGVPAITAYASLFEAGSLQGLSVLVSGAAGAVGHYAVQFARLAGASQVIATISGPEKAAHVALAKPDAIINYRQEDVIARVMELTGGRGVDRVSEVNYAANAHIVAEVVARHAWVGVYGARAATEPNILPLRLIAKHVGFRFIQCNILPLAFRQQAVQDLTRWAAEGKLIHAVSKIFDLEDIAAAHEAVESGAIIGNVLLRV